MDKETSNRLPERFRKRIGLQVVTPSKYVANRGNIALMAVRHAVTALGGRDARLLLPADPRMAIFILTPREMRAESICRFFNYSFAEAHMHIRETGTGRRVLRQKHVNRNLGDWHLHDLVINRARMNEERADEPSVSRFGRRFSEAELIVA